MIEFRCLDGIGPATIGHCLTGERPVVAHHPQTRRTPGEVHGGSHESGPQKDAATWDQARVAGSTGMPGAIVEVMVALVM